jgi:uncharacterized protein YbaR (Trm112 family)
MSPLNGDAQDSTHGARTDIPTLAELLSARPPAGTYEDLHHAIGADEGARGFAIILPDLHSNAGVQKNLAHLIAFYSSQFGIPQCYVEGASGESDFYIWETLPVELRASFCERLLQQAYLTGAELFCIDHPEIACDIYGVDAPTLYRIQSYAAALIQDSGPRLARKAKHALSAFMARIQRTPADFASVALIIQRLFELMNFKRNSVDMTGLLRIADSYSVPTNNVEALPSVVQQYDLEDSLLWLEFSWMVEDSVASQLNLSDFARLHQLLVLSTKAFRLELHNELQPFVTTVGQAVTTGEIMRQATAVQSAWNLGGQWLRTVESLTNSWPLPNTFYFYAIQRSKQMAHTVAECMEKQGHRGALVVSGGFHSAVMARWLWENHRVKSVTIQPSVSSLGDGIFYTVRLVAEMRNWSYTKALLYLTPLLILQHGPLAYIRKLIALWTAHRRLQKARRLVSHGPDIGTRYIALSEVLQRVSRGTVLLVETGDLSSPFLYRRGTNAILADNFTYYAGKLDMPGERWTWPDINYVNSPLAAVCCLRSYLPIRSSSIDEVVWIPRFFTIREVDRARAAREMLRTLRPGGTLRVWLRPGGKDIPMADAIEAAGGYVLERSQRWLIAQKSDGEAIVLRPENPITEPILSILVLPSKGVQFDKLDQQLITHLTEHRLTTLCQRRILSGLHEDLANPLLGLRRPTVNETQSILQSDLDEATRSATLAVVIVNHALLDLLGGVAGLRQMLGGGHEWASRVFFLIEALNDDLPLGAGAYFCSDILKALAIEGTSIAEAIRDIIRTLYAPDFAPKLPNMLLGYLGCPECPERPSLALQTGYVPPRHSDGVLVCRVCKTAFHVRNGVPEITALAEMRDTE